MKRTLIAAAVLATAASSAFAGPKTAYLFNVTGVSDVVDIDGFVRMSGRVHVSSTAGAVINNTQNTGGGTLLPQLQSYDYGNVTTTYNDKNWSVNGTGTNSAYATTSYSEQDGSMSSRSSSRTHDVNASTTKSSSSSYSYNKNRSASIDAAVHVKTDSGSTSDTKVSNKFSDTGSSSFSDTSSNVGSNTSKNSQSATGDLSLSAKWTHTGNRRNGSASLTLSGSESTSQTKSSSHDNSNTAKDAKTWSVNNTLNAENSKSTANTGYADASLNASVSTKESGSGDRMSNSKNTYAHSYSESSTSKSQDSHSSSRSTEARNTWGYSVSDSLKTVDETTTGSLTHHTDTRKAATLDATTGDGAATGVTGNLGVNIAEGINNAQSNDVALASVDVGNVFGNAQIFNNQASAGKANVKNFNLNASVGDGSLASVSGNVGVNVASGIGNAQNNSLAGSVTTAKNAGSAQTTAMVATDNNVQNAGMTATGQFQGTASLGAHTLTGASGNIGVNIAGGIGNLQHNGMAIAAMSNGH
ncbi:cell wall anchor protein [Paraburkholderia sacchari]|uniref:cell wall anchor protein n=1 Tax=Paraburkholderia sacchari TaxID=159450 RepID=UPI001BCA938D|nr:cell wall anchor protein [Paraburkholderia sacchari]